MAQVKSSHTKPVQLTSPDLHCPEAYHWTGGSVSATRGRDMLLHARRYVVMKLHFWHLPVLEQYAIADAVQTLGVALSQVQLEIMGKGESNNGNTSTTPRE